MRLHRAPYRTSLLDQLMHARALWRFVSPSALLGAEARRGMQQPHAPSADAGDTSPVSAVDGASLFLVEIIPPREGRLDALALENLLQALLLETHEPLALELVACQQRLTFLLRAASSQGLAHACAQLQARAPQADIRPSATDPLAVQAGEQVRARTLHPRAGAHVPIKLYQQRELGEDGVDPLLGVLAALSHPPAGARLIAHLALTPAPDAWSADIQRLAVEHPLERERARDRAYSSASSEHASGLPLFPLLALLGIVALARQAFLWYQAASQAHDLRHLLLGIVGAVAAVAIVVALLAVRARLRRTPIYDMRLVEERARRLALRVSLVVVAIAQPATPQAAHGVAHGVDEPHGSPPDGPPGSATLDSLSEALDRVIAAYRQHHLASGNGFVASSVRPRLARTLSARWARQARRSRFLLNTRELAALWHLPAGDAEIPLLERAGARKLLALPQPLAHGYPLGVSTQGGRAVPIRLPADALRRHALLVAKTGKGKSSLLLRLACAQLAGDEASGQLRGPARAEQRPGLIVVDPHGDLVAHLLGVIPPARRDDVILVDLADVAYPVALNPLDALLGRDRDKAVESLLRILSQIWARFWGPRMQNALEYALKTLYEANEALVAADPQRGPDQQFTLLEVAPLLSAPGFRRDVLTLVRDQALHTWWTHYYQPLDFRLQLEIINPVLTKLASFSGSRVARRVVGQARSTLNLSEVVREGRVLLVNTAKGVVGAETATLVGATLLGTLHVALEEQARLAPEQRRRTLVIVDEFQSLLGVDYGAMLSELRKFGGAFALATQALAHLDTLEQGHPTASPSATLRATVLANVDALYAFAVSAEDARFLSRELDERVSVTDLINLDDYALYAKLTLAGRRLPTFSLRLDPPPQGDPAEAQRLRARARARYARPVEVVDEALAQAAARYLPPHELTRMVEQAGQAAEASPAAASGTSGTSGTGGTGGSATAGKPSGGRGRFGRASGKAAQRAVSLLMAESLWPETPASDLTPPAPQQSQMPDTALIDDSEGVLGTERPGSDELDDVDEGEGRGEGAREEP
jgi:hypothetical protein